MVGCGSDGHARQSRDEFKNNAYYVHLRIWALLPS